MLLRSIVRYIFHIHTALSHAWACAQIRGFRVKHRAIDNVQSRYLAVDLKYAAMLVAYRRRGQAELIAIGRTVAQGFACQPTDVSTPAESGRVTILETAVAEEISSIRSRAQSAPIADSSSGPQAALADEAAALVADLHAAFGNHHARAVHAKGVILVGTFTPADEARTLSRAELFSKPSVPVTVRFSNFTGIPDIPDNIGAANPRGMAIKFNVGDSRDFDIVCHSFNGFPVSTAEEFGHFLENIAMSGEGVPHPTPLDKYLANHPVAQRFLTTQKPPPVSYATTSYFGVNSFAFISKSEARTFVRFQFAPTAGEHYLDASVAKSMGSNYLAPEIVKRVAEGPVRFDWYAQHAAEGDRIEDPSVSWPDTRVATLLGTISLQEVVRDQLIADKALHFMPATLPPGVEAADPMLAIRNAAYPISYRQRQ
ncbi:catalase family peroxidase [Tardiphaga sp. 862_B3_N1_1]|uniref:catalase family peroxidase n=1 Tax=Tardiphaga sp. 862_B3_N1_1 TaxID=3240763 RepID=UPI003F8985F6